VGEGAKRRAHHHGERPAKFGIDTIATQAVGTAPMAPLPTLIWVSRVKRRDLAWDFVWVLIERGGARSHA
jgi:hypothetical protein